MTRRERARARSRQRRRGTITATIVAVGLFAAVGTMAYAVDNLIVDGDAISPIDNHALALGNVCPGGTINVSPSSVNVLTQVEQANSGVTNNFANSANITVTVGTITDAAEGTLTATMVDSTIALPADWNTSRGSKESAVVSANGTASSKVALTAGTTPGNYEGEVQYVATQDDTTFNRNHDLDVSWTVLEADDPACASSNASPTADAGGPYTGTEGTAVELDGSGSDDSDGSIPANGYTWTYDVVTADPGTSCTFDDATIQKPKITCDDDGSFTVGLVVTDDEGATSTQDTATLTLGNAAPEITSAAFAAATTTCGDDNVSLTVTFTDAGANDTHTLEIDWDNDGTYDDTVDPYSGTAITHEYNSGAHTAKVRITDDDGDSDTSSDAEVFVEYDVSEFLPPVNNTGHGQTPSVFKSKSTVPLKLSITDCDGAAVSGLTPTVSVVRLTGNTPPSGDDEAVSTANPTTGTTMRFSDPIYIYNLNARSLSDPTATYEVTVTIEESGQTVSTVIGLKP